MTLVWVFNFILTNTNIFSKVTLLICESLNANQQLERIVKIDYSWLFSKNKYFFESKWRWDKQFTAWKIVIQKQINSHYTK